MKHWITYPLIRHPYDPAFVDGGNMRRFARAAEAAGFAGLGFTDHPAPSQRWLEAGGHDALDPFAALAFVAACTEHIRLIPNIVVLPYRNPFIVAKAAATIDALSGGRFILAVGSGYLRAEFKALGVDADARNELFDEALEVLRGVWSTDDFAYAGRNFTAVGQTSNPKPSHVPIWIGGNSARARQRVADAGDGWSPFPAPASLARTAKTPALETIEDLSAMVADLHRRLDRAGRDPASIDIGFAATAGGSPTAAEFDVESHVRELDQLAGLGVTWNQVSVPGDSVDHAIEVIERYGAEVIGRG